MKYLYPLAVLCWLTTCHTGKTDNRFPPHSRRVAVQLADSLGLVTMTVPERYDTGFLWIHKSDCGIRCDEWKYRYQPAALRIVQESGFLYIDRSDAIDRFTIRHSRKMDYHENDTTYYHRWLAIQREEARKDGTTGLIRLDTFLLIGDRYLSIVAFDLSDSLQRKKVTASTIINNGPVEFSYELLSAKRDSITDHFIPEAVSFLKTIRIHGERK
nr:hypothetical protein [uncultured Chitinophaga sp.]